MQTPDRQRQAGRVSAPTRPRTDRRWLAVPIAFFIGAALAVSLLVAVDDHRTVTVQRNVVAPATTLSTSQSAQDLQLLADEAREVQAQRLARMRARSLVISARAAAHHSAAPSHQGRARAGAGAQASGGAAAPAHAPRQQSSHPRRRAAARRPQTREHPHHAHNGSAREHHEETAKRRKQETAERREQHARAQEERAASPRGAGKPR